MEPIPKIPFYSNENFSNGKTLQQVTNQLIELVSHYSENSNLYCFGLENKSHFANNIFSFNKEAEDRNWHYYLLLITEKLKPNITANLMDLVHKDSNGFIKITLICHTPKQIRTSHNEHLHFVAKVIQSGWLVYGKPYELAELKLTNLPELDIKGIITYSTTRLEIARNFQMIATSSQASLVTSALLHSMLEQVCLGMLYAFLHYRPNHFHLGYLLKLCSLFSKAPKEFFLQNPTFSKTLQQMLHTSRHDLKFRNTDIYSQTDLMLLKNLCYSFSKSVIPEIKAKLEQLKNGYHGYK